MDVDTARAKWKELHDDWHAAEQEARQLESGLTQKYVNCAVRTGPGPTTDEEEAAAQARRVADVKRMTVDGFLIQHFGA